MNEKHYLVQFNLDCYGDDSIVPVMTKIYTCVPYWNDITQEQREEEIKLFALSQLEDADVFIQDELIRNVEITEI